MAFLTPVSPRTLLLTGAIVGFVAGCESKDSDATETGSPVCNDGDEKAAGDGCNTCTCEGGQWGCTDMGCTSPDCGNGVVDPGETCDDSNLVEGDGCSAECTLEDAATGGPACDEAEKPPDDGCNVCSCEGGVWGCTDMGCSSTDTAGTTMGPADTCGDAVLDPGEACDDGNLVEGDGCSSSCSLEVTGPLELCSDSMPLDEFTIVDAGIDGDTLAVTVEYGGGCETHDFGHCWDGVFLESSPVAVTTQIWHDAHMDGCEAGLTELRFFDLVPLRTQYQDSYQTDSGEIVLNLAGWAGGQLLYSF